MDFNTTNCLIYIGPHARKIYSKTIIWLKKIRVMDSTNCDFWNQKFSLEKMVFLMLSFILSFVYVINTKETVFCPQEYSQV